MAKRKPLQFDVGCELLGMQCPIPEWRFHPTRRWRFDWAFIESMLAVEIDGGVWLKGGGRHNRGSGYLKDCEKFNTAACMGWRILKFTPQQVASGECYEIVKKAMEWKR